MEQSDINNSVWKSLVLNKIQLDLNYLPAKILLAKWRVVLKNDPQPIKIEEAVQEVFKLYLRGKDSPNAMKDIMMLLHK